MGINILFSNFEQEKSFSNHLQFEITQYSLSLSLFCYFIISFMNKKFSTTRCIHIKRFFFFFLPFYAESLIIQYYYKKILVIGVLDKSNYCVQASSLFVNTTTTFDYCKKLLYTNFCAGKYILPIEITKGLFHRVAIVYRCRKVDIQLISRGQRVLATSYIQSKTQMLWQKITYNL